MDKPIKPTNLLPESFGGIKENFSNNKILNGYEANIKEIVEGENLNYLINASGENFKYNNAISDFITGIPINKTITTDVNNKLTYTQYDLKTYEPNELYNINQWVTGIVDDKKSIYQSLINNNKGNNLTDNTKWAKFDINGANVDLSNLSEEGEKKLGNTLPLFFPYISDHVLTGDEALGWALQGSLITNTYVSAVQRIQEEYLAGVEKTDTIGELLVTYKSSNGFKIADISQKSIIDEVFNSTGFADYYILDSTNNQFYLPRNKNFIQFTDDVSKINDYVEAGMPNVFGELTGIKVTNPTASGCINIKKNYASNYIQSGQSGLSDIEINAALSSTLYGASETVQPQSSYKLLYYKVGNVVINESLIDVSNLTNDVLNKADKDLSNCTKPYVLETFEGINVSYRLWSNNDLEQWGITSTENRGQIVTFPLEYSSIPVLVTGVDNVGSNNVPHFYDIGYNNLTTTGFIHGSHTGVVGGWYAKGKKKEG